MSYKLAQLAKWPALPIRCQKLNIIFKAIDMHAKVMLLLGFHQFNFVSVVPCVICDNALVLGTCYNYDGGIRFSPQIVACFIREK